MKGVLYRQAEMTRETFSIRDVPIYGSLILAPMSGYNDQPFRRLCREFGAALVYTGLLSASAISYASPRSDEMLRFHPDEHPLACQLFGSDEQVLERAARTVEALGIAVLDFNIGCAEPKIVKGGYGAALLKEPATIGRLMTRLVRAVQVPVTGKMRLGWDANSRNYLEVAHILEDSGAALIAVHGRTADQGYLGVADWDAIAKVKQAVHIPVLASGDVKCAADIDRLQAHTGCDGVMIGRAAIGNPWIFQRRDLPAVPLAERVPVIVRHLRDMVEFHGIEQGVPRFRKHLRRYLTGTAITRRQRRDFMVCDDADTLVDWLEATV
ncbi:MAG TPA: tRNA dihydrouridine synthase DusB [Anaerolineae bacterium]|nr:tRNA dihydrouridine synthase DusB [Anaerolineae bacterium]HQH37540.1 tRNA dihydrouridine synthase DusB [Anaerolineae bacterium]